MNLRKLYRSFSPLRVFVFSIVGAFFLLGFLGVALTWWSFQGTPRYEGKVKLKGLKKRVSVDYDHFGVAHIRGEQEGDVFRSLGYIMAQDRLFQMDMLKRAVRGELAQVFGKKALPADLLFRQLSLTALFKERVEKNSFEGHERERREMFSQLQAFYDGVNSFIAEGNFSYEYKLLGIRPTPFELSDAYGVLGFMAYSFSQAFKTDLFFDALKSEFGEDYVNSLRPFPRLKGEKRVSKRDGGENLKKDLLKERELFHGANSFLQEYIGTFTGSNAWAISGERALKGAPLLASDPHVQFSLPGIWYEAVLDWGEGPFFGLFVPGVPFAAMGHRQELGWGVTISYIDAMDFYRERRRGDQVFFQGHWVDLKKREEMIPIRGEAPLSFTALWGPHGPLLEGVHPLLKGENRQLALKWGHYRKDNDAPLAFYHMMKAKKREDFKEAMALAKSPGLNIIYADAQGNIGRYLFGSIPLRPKGMRGDLVYGGDLGVYDYGEDWAFEDRPHIENPKKGYVVSANARPEKTELFGYYAPSDRFDTISQLLGGEIGGKRKWSLEQLKYVQTSFVDLYHLPLRDKIISYLSSDFEEGKGGDQRRGGDEGEQDRLAYHFLKNWDGKSTVESVGASLFQVLKREIAKEMLRPLTGKSEENFYLFCETNFFDQHISSRLLRGRFKGEIIKKAFRLSVDFLRENYGSVGKAKWGRLHHLTFSHPLSKGGRLLSFIFNRGPYPLGGAKGNINNNRSVGCRDGFRVKSGPSSRRLIDFSNPQESLAVLPLGNSGHWKSPFFANQWELFSQGKYRKLKLLLSQRTSPESSSQESEIFGHLEMVP